MKALVPTFITPRLCVRQLEVTDAAAYQRFFANYEVIRHLAYGVPWPYPDNGALDYITTQIVPQQGISRWTWAITLKERSDELIGAVELLRQANPANRGFWLARPFWGQGYMTEAVAPITDYAFSQLGFEKLVFSNAVSNQRSARIKHKAGAKFVRREPARYVDPTYGERDIFELTRESWLAGVKSSVG